MHSHHLSNCLGGLVSFQKREEFVFCYKYCTKFILRNIKFLLIQGFISGYTTRRDEKNLTLLVYLRYCPTNLTPLISNIRFFSRPGSFWFVGKKKLFYLVKRNPSSTLVVSTSKGLLTGTHSLAYGGGGLLLYQIN